MAGMVAIPQDMMGQALDELTIKAALIRLNNRFHFDWATAKNIWHPYQDGKQGVYHDGKHLCSMDRGTIPMAPIWSTKLQSVRRHRSDMSYSQLTDKFTIAEIEYKPDGTERETGYYFFREESKDRLLWIGWQATLRKVIAYGIPGVTEATVGKELGITFDAHRDVAELEVAENRTHLYDASGREVSVGA